MAKDSMEIRVSGMPTEKGLQRMWTFVCGNYARNIAYSVRGYEDVFRKARQTAILRLQRGENLLPLRPSTKAQEGASTGSPMWRTGRFANAMEVLPVARGKDHWHVNLGWSDEAGMTPSSPLDNSPGGFLYSSMAKLFGEGKKASFSNDTSGRFKFFDVTDSSRILKPKKRTYPTQHPDARPTGNMAGWGFPRRSLFPTVPRMQAMIEKNVKEMAHKQARITLKRVLEDGEQVLGMGAANVKASLGIGKVIFSIRDAPKEGVALYTRRMKKLTDLGEIKRNLEAAQKYLSEKQWNELVKKLKVDM
jgi:hypothetical protein